MKRKKKFSVVFLLFVILGISVGYALLSTTLKINGYANLKGNTWNIFWDSESINVTSGSVSASNPVVSTTDSSNDTVEFSVNLELPGDYYEFTIDAVNNGTVDAMISNINTLITDANEEETTLPNYIKYSVTYANGGTVSKKHLFPKKNGNTATIEKYKIRLEYDSNTDILPSSDLVFNIKTSISYSQADDTAIAKPVSFSTDSWKTIVDAVKTGNTSAYNVGDIKSLMMDVNDNGTESEYKIRVVNKTTPTECSNSGYSKTACGFVFEILGSSDEYTKVKSSGSSIGGWRDSELRTYLNTNLYNHLPDEIKNAIVKTNVVSGHSYSDSDNYATEDYIFELSSTEVYGPTNTQDYAKDNSRQLDYYEDLGVTPTNYSIINTGTWWLRNPYNYNNSNVAYCVISNSGSLTYAFANSNNKVLAGFKFN